MRWYRRLRWKLLVSHTLVGVIAVAVLIVTIYFLTNVGFLQDNPMSLAFPGNQPLPNNAQRDFVDVHRVLFHVTMRDALIVASVAAIEAALIVSISISSRIIEPLRAMTQVSRRLAQGAYHERTVIPSDDELADLSKSVNQLAETLEQTEQRRTALIADVTHEIRTPLATIGGYMEGMLDGVVQPNEQTFKLVLNETARLQRLVDDMQLLSQVEAGEIAIKPQRLNPEPLLRDIVLRHHPEFAQAHIDLRLSIPEPVGFVRADPDRLTQIMVNLLSNARRYTPEGGTVTVRAYLAEDVVVFCVEDTGIGIAPEHLSNVFERFYRVDKSRARRSGGSGVGLTIARQLAYSQGGYMWATSEGVGKGTCFYFILPRWADVTFAPGSHIPVAIDPSPLST